ncbi:homoserine/homoserine lactone efflux protein [Paraburkholderia atlantica]|uniref:Threonine/homoserine/homoserine lactone efflux protein n=2 Tax=Paraburkholderia TaxID=1822464 RepID=A0A7W8LEK1_9BURK|nr:MULTISPECIES: LysE family translocator [Paraburkholderia]MBB5404306.1 threonine/homoserine/homoserine lactone efflux protein [Paraburkholderia youngii]MBB5420393.1 threonine/homoserine/homoserine lactone efflux protein [Paraburkholderia atlantica]MBB5428840.1 threonine/homoserine/homoserine lactone efflux protein [Paraburkholderia atlantica]MPW09939.1 LysE family translocator [Paraburkholderia atlantica]NUY34293.1 LysE family translocator [Paraburkholderia atlantica]
MDFHLFVLFLVTFTAAVALPGPNVIFAVAQTLKHGLKIAIPGAIGFGTGAAVHAAVVLSGVGIFIQDNQWVLLYVRWIGAIYLGCLAIIAFCGKRESRTEDAVCWNSRQVFVDSLIVSLANPKGWLATLVTYPSFISPSGSYLGQAVPMGAAATAISVGVYCGYMFLADRASVVLSNRSMLEKITGALYACVAASLLFLNR